MCMRLNALRSCKGYPWACMLWSIWQNMAGRQLMITDKGCMSPSTRLLDLNLLSHRRCLHALPAEHACEIALQLASIPALAAGSSQSMFLAFLQERESGLSSKQQSTLEAIRLSLHLPQPWRDRLSHLLGERCMKEPCTDSRKGCPASDSSRLLPGYSKQG